MKTGLNDDALLGNIFRCRLIHIWCSIKYLYQHVCVWVNRLNRRKNVARHHVLNMKWFSLKHKQNMMVIIFSYLTLILLIWLCIIVLHKVRHMLKYPWWWVRGDKYYSITNLSIPSLGNVFVYDFFSWRGFTTSINNLHLFYWAVHTPIPLNFTHTDIWKLSGGPEGRMVGGLWSSLLNLEIVAHKKLGRMTKAAWLHNTHKC